MCTSLKINGQSHVVEAEPDCLLLYVLRDDLAILDATGARVRQSPLTPKRVKAALSKAQPA